MSSQDKERPSNELLNSEVSDQDSQQLVAYLDGELDDQSSRDVERRLSDDPEFRLRLQQLQQAWDLLDELPRANRDEAFTRSTVEFVTFNVRQQLAETKQWIKPGKGKTILWRLVITLLATGLGWWLGDWYFGQGHREILRDIEVISEFDQYRLTEEFEFLEKLEQSGVFDKEGACDEE